MRPADVVRLGQIASILQVRHGVYESIAALRPFLAGVWIMFSTPTVSPVSIYAPNDGNSGSPDLYQF